jgi:hypothetical protein
MFFHPTRVVERGRRDQSRADNLVKAPSTVVEVPVVLSLDLIIVLEILGDWIDEPLRIWLVMDEIMACVRELGVGKPTGDASVVLREDLLVVVIEGLFGPREVVPGATTVDTVPFLSANCPGDTVACSDVLVTEAATFVVLLTVAIIVSVRIAIRDEAASPKAADSEMVTLLPKTKAELPTRKLPE